MPRAKRSNVVSLTKVQKNTRSLKENLVNTIRTYIQQFKRLVLFSYEGMRSNTIRDIKGRLQQSKICLGKSKVMAIALGRTEQEQFMENLSFVSTKIRGNMGMVFTNHKIEDLSRFVDDYEAPDFALAGTVSPRTIVLEKGEKTLASFCHSMAPYLRELGLNVRLDNQKIILDENFILAEEGKVLNV